MLALDVEQNGVRLIKTFRNAYFGAGDSASGYVAIDGRV
jgi:hypothetical protein